MIRQRRQRLACQLAPRHQHRAAFPPAVTAPSPKAERLATEGDEPDEGAHILACWTPWWHRVTSLDLCSHEIQLDDTVSGLATAPEVAYALYGSSGDLRSLPSLRPAAYMQSLHDYVESGDHGRRTLFTAPEDSACEAASEVSSPHGGHIQDSESAGYANNSDAEPGVDSEYAASLDSFTLSPRRSDSPEVDALGQMMECLSLRDKGAAADAVRDMQRALEGEPPGQVVMVRAEEEPGTTSPAPDTDACDFEKISGSVEPFDEAAADLALTDDWILLS